MGVTEEHRPLADGVARVVTSAAGRRCTAEAATRLTGGASRETWHVDVRPDRGAPFPVIVRRDPPGHGEPARMRGEVACLGAAGRAGAPVPAVLASGDTAPGIDAPFIVMDKLPGEALPRRIQRDRQYEDIRPRLAWQMGHVLGRIHSADIAELGMLDSTDPVAAIEATYLAFDEPRPAVEIGLRRLRENRLPARPHALVHGDFRLGNLLVAPDGLHGVLDWELAHLGDPVEDLGWLCVRAWRFGATAPVAGVGDRNDLLDGYEHATGDRPTREELHWWEVYGTLRWLVLSRFQAERHLSGTEHSIELAAIGRRVAESEYDLLHILDIADGAAEPRASQPYASRVQDRPDAAGIIDLVAETLAHEIGPNLQPEQQHEKYLLKISASLLTIVGRELRAGDGAQQALAATLTSLGCASEAELATRLRDGALSTDDPGVRQAINTGVQARLAVSRPGYAHT